MLIAQYRPALTGLLLVGCIFSNAHANGDKRLAVRGEPIVVEGDILTGERLMTRGVARANESRWRDGVIPYRVDTELAAYSIAFIEEAIDTWNSVSAISLVPIENVSSEYAQDYIYFKPGAGCASWVGRQGGRQDIWVAPNCSAGSMMHEIGHAIGLEHEHTRPDRDQYIQINWGNVKPEKMQNFNASSDQLRMVGAYDYHSIMHYGSKFFSSNGEDTIVPLFADQASIGQRDKPSEGDIEAVSSLYSNHLTLRVLAQQLGSSSDVSLYVDNNAEQGSHSVSVAMYVGAARLVSRDNGLWSCNQEGVNVICNLSRIAGYSEEVMQIQFDGTVDESSLQARFVPSKSGTMGDTAGAQSSGEKPAALFSDEGASANAGASSYSLLLLLLYWVVQLQRARMNHARSGRH